MRLRRLVTLLATLVAGLALSVGPASAAPEPDPDFDVSSYLGQWYQIQDIPQFYEFACAKNTRAEYSANPDGTVKVVNRCTTLLGTTFTVRGTARVVDPAVPAGLQVSFLNLFGKQYYFGGVNYLVLDVADDGSYAVVGHPDRVSAYILSRTPTLSPAKTAAARAVLSDAGYDLSKLRTTRQDG